MLLDPLLKTFWQSEEVVLCRSPSFCGIVLRLIPLWIQCFLLHPHFSKSSTLRWVRLLLTPYNVYILITTPVHYRFLPLTNNGASNCLLALWVFQLTAKSLEWGLTNGYWASERCNKSTSESSPTPTASVPSASTEGNSWTEIASWTTRQLFSSRGYHGGWGLKPQHKVPSVFDLIQRIIIVNCVRAIPIAFILTARDKGSPDQVLATLGVPDFPLRSTLAEGLSALSLLQWIIVIDTFFCKYGLICHAVHWIGGFVKIPKLILDLCDPNCFQHAFNSPHTATSLSWLWGKGWHQFFRRNYMICGGIPASAMAKRFGGGLKVQKVCGILGSFFISAIQHEFIIHAIARKPHPFPYTYLEEFPGAFVYFMLQAIGIILEPYIIPYIPQKLGGGWLWVLIFTFFTGQPIANQYAYNFRLFDNGFKPVNEWTITTVLLGCFH